VGEGLGGASLSASACGCRSARRRSVIYSIRIGTCLQYPHWLHLQYPHRHISTVSASTHVYIIRIGTYRHYPHRIMAVSPEGYVCTFHFHQQLGVGSGEHGHDLRGYLQQQHWVLLEQAQRACRLNSGSRTAGPFQCKFSNLNCLCIFDVLGGQGDSLICPYPRYCVCFPLCFELFDGVPRVVVQGRHSSI